MLSLNWIKNRFILILKIINSILWDNTGTELYLKPDGFSKAVYTSHTTINDGREGIASSMTDSIYYYEESNLSIDPKFISPEILAITKPIKMIAIKKNKSNILAANLLALVANIISLIFWSPISSNDFVELGQIL